MGMKMTFGMPSLLLGFIMFVLGLLPLLAGFGVLPFALPGFLTGLYGSVGIYILAGLGLYLIIEDLTGFGDWWNTWLPLFIGLIFLAAGVINILNKFGIIGFGIPGLPEIVYQVLFMVEGFALFLGAMD